MNPLAFANDIASVGPALFNFITGAIQKHQANQLHPVRPTYEIPGAINRAQQLADTQATQGLAGASQIADSIKSNTANTAGLNNNTASGAESVYGNAMLGAQANNELLGLGVKDAQVRQGNIAADIAQEGTTAQYQDKAFEYNKAEPYMQEIQKQAELRKSGQQNEYQGINQLAGGGAGIAGQIAKMFSPTSSTGGQRGGGSQTSPIASGGTSSPGDVVAGTYLPQGYTPAPSGSYQDIQRLYDVFDKTGDSNNTLANPFAKSFTY